VVLGELECETALEQVCRNVPVTGRLCTAMDVGRALSERRFDRVSHIAVCDEEASSRVLRVEDLLPASASTTTESLMDPEPPVVGPGLDQEKAARKEVKHGESALAVVDARGLFVGFVPPRGSSKCCSGSTTRTSRASAACVIARRWRARRRTRRRFEGGGIGCLGCSPVSPEP
jgi:hypothetical protein